MPRKSTWNCIYAIGIICAIFCPTDLIAQRPVKVFVLAGQSNMQGKGEIYSNGGRRAVGSLEYEVKHDKTGIYKHFLDKKGDWRVRRDVWVWYDRGGNELKKGDLSVGYGTTDKLIGPEFQFGYLLGDYYRNQVLIIKTAWGGKSLGVDFRPPGLGGSGIFYKKMIEDIDTALNNLSVDFPGYKGKGYEIAGFVWNQGWNDAGDSALYKEYKTNMVHFIKDVRHDLQSPDLPFVIANCGQGGLHPSNDPWMRRVQTYIVQAQAAAAAIPEFSGNVALVDDRPFWKDSLESPSDQIYHYNSNAGTYFMMGNAIGHAMIKLLKKSANSKKLIKYKSYYISGQVGSTGEINGSGLMGYISFRTTPQPPGYGSGIGFYSAVYPILPQPINNFQIGLASTWIIPDNSDNLTQALCPVGTFASDNWEHGRGPTFKDVLQTIKGGLGIWGSTQFRSGYRYPKFQIVGVPDCYSGNYLISPGWGNNTSVTKDDKMGVAQLSNRILVPPDGITFHGNPNGELFGYSWMSLPLSKAKKGPPPTGDNYWTLFLASSNFTGPVAFIIPDSYSKISANYIFDYGRGLDSRDGRSGGGAQEINTVPYFEMKDSAGNIYSKIPEVIYPVNNRDHTILIQDIRYYSNKALANAILSWRDGGPPCSGKFGVSDSASVLAKVIASPLDFHQTDKKFPLSGFKKVVQTAEVPTQLVEKTFEAATNGRTYTTSPHASAWSKPGPVSGPYYAYLADGSKVTYYWYRFIDQPALQQYKNVWSNKLRFEMQLLVKNIQKNWGINREYMQALSNGKDLVAIDPALMVTPPMALKKGMYL